MKLLERIKYFLSTKQRVTSFKVIYEYKNGEYVFRREKVEVEVASKDALLRGYVIESDLDDWEICDKIEEDISDEMASKAEKLLKKIRKGSKTLYNNRGVLISGKHIIGVDWSVGYPEFKPLTFEEYLKEYQDKAIHSQK